MKFKMTVEYDGTNYVGWQIQKNGMSVQEKLENAMEKLFKTHISTTASGRTDSGVHAKGQVVSFFAETTIPADKIPFALNNLLPIDISAVGCEMVDDDFNARFSAKRKTYVYKVYTSSIPHPMLERYHTRIVQKLDFEEMVKAAKFITGKHDFKCFQAVGSVVNSTVREIYDLTVTKKIDCGTEIFEFSVTGNGFLYNMVRIIAGTLVYVGLHKIKSSDIEKIIKTKDRKHAGKTLGPNGLCLMSVEYDK